MDDFLPPRPTVQVELSGVHVDDFLPSPPTVRVELNRDHVDKFIPPPRAELNEVYHMWMIFSRLREQ